MDRNALFKNGMYMDAADTYILASALVGGHAVCLSNAAAALRKIGEYESAAETATEALEQDPKNVKARYRRGVARKHMNYLKAAVSDFENVLQLDSKCLEAREELKIARKLLEAGGGDETGFHTSEDEAPHPDDDPGNGSSDSYDSDYFHYGCGIPCRSFNRDVCKKGTACRNSHAPDEKSIRDLLGRNVCIYHLLDACKYGDACVYNHIPDFLEHWPLTLEAGPMLRGVLKEARGEDASGLPIISNREYLYQQAKLLNKRPGYFVHPLGGETWSPGVGKYAETSHDARVGSDIKPAILLVSLMECTMFNGIHNHLLDALSSHCSEPWAVFVTDPELANARSPHQALTTKLVKYVKDGGTVVFGGMFSSHVRPNDSDTFFKNVWGLDWKTGSYHRSTFSLNTQTHPRLLRGLELPELYNVKTQHLVGVAAQDVVYAPAEGSTTQSLVFAPRLTDRREVPVAYTQIGDGFLGYNGEVNGEDETTDIILSLLGVGLSDKEPKKRDKSSDTSRAPTFSSSSKTVIASAANPIIPFVLLVSIMGPEDSCFEDVYGNFLKSLSNKAEWTEAQDSDVAIGILSTRQVTAVFVTDPAIASTQSTYAALAAALVTYAEAGGIVVFGGMFSSYVTPSDNNSFFKSNWGLDWTMGDYHRADFKANPRRHAFLKSGPGTPKEYNVKTVHLKGVAPEDVVYLPAGDADPLQVPVAYTRFGTGYVGYHGEVNGEEKTTLVLLTMMGMPAHNLPKPTRKWKAPNKFQMQMCPKSLDSDGSDDDDTYGDDSDEGE
ncbi:hypothetical protein HWV62_34533 [Athelia sp. TMB]|nr:hypothetical protein HWV62_34533 [Athelia sp. TMB]